MEGRVERLLLNTALRCYYVWWYEETSDSRREPVKLPLFRPDTPVAEFK